MNGVSSGETARRPTPPDVLLAELEASVPTSGWVAQLRRDVAAVHGHPLDAAVEPLPTVRFDVAARHSMGR